MGQSSRHGWIWGPWSRPGLAVALATLVIDQLSKWWLLAVYGIEGRGRVSVLPFFDLVFVKNLGISYGLGAGLLSQTLLAGAAVVAALILTVWLARGANNGLLAASLGLIIGGAIGNAIDRVHLGGVADFFLLHAFGWSWYVFNIADAAIVAGVVGLLYDSVIASRNNAPNRT
jgi:signal peptidase II